MNKTALTLAWAVLAFSWTAFGQDTGERSAGRERSGQRERGSGADSRRPPLLPIIDVLDADGDGVIDAGEVAKASTALKKLDKNGDGKLSDDEYLPPRPGGFGGPEGPPPGAPGGPDRGTRRGFAGPAEGRAGQATFDSSPLAKDEEEKAVLAVLEDMDKNERRGMMSVPRDDGRFLRLLAESLGPKNVVEIGTSHGYSAVWLCLALRATGGKLTTFEIDAERVALARKNFKRAGVEDIVTLVEGDAHEEVAKLKDPIDVLFLDADKEGYLDYLNKLLPLIRPGGLIVAHNMSARQADPRYVKAITTNPKLETLFVDLGGSGIGLTLKKR